MIYFRRGVREWTLKSLGQDYYFSGVQIRHCRYPPPLELADDICNSGSQMKDRKYFDPRDRWYWKSVRNLSDGRRTRHTSCTNNMNATLGQDLKFEIPKPRCDWKAGVFFVIISYIRGEAGYLFPLFFLCFRYHDCCLRRTRSSQWMCFLVFSDWDNCRNRNVWTVMARTNSSQLKILSVYERNFEKAKQIQLFCLREID